MHGGKRPQTRVGVIRLALRINGDPPCTTRPDWTAPCHYSRWSAFCKYPKPTIFASNFRDYSHKREKMPKFQHKKCDKCRFRKNVPKCFEKTFQKGLDKRHGVWYNTCAKKQNVPRSHLAAKERARLIVTYPKGVFVSCGVFLRAIFYYSGTPRNWR